MSLFRPNYRRARALFLEIEATQIAIDEAKSDPGVSHDHIEDLKAELQHLEHQFFLTGVSSEYEL